MADWIIEGEKPSITQQPATVGSQLGRLGTMAGLNALKGLESVFIGLPGLLGIKPPHPAPSELIQELGNISPEYLEPQNIGEQFLQRFSAYAPLAATGGLGGLARTAAGSGIAAGLGALGAPQAVQDIAQLGSELGLGFATRKIPTIRAAQHAEDVLARAAVKPRTLAHAPQIQSALMNIENKLGTEVSEKYATKIRHALGTIEKNLTQEKINPTTAMDLRKKLYKLGNELPEHISTEYLQPLTKSINDFFSVYAAENPTFYKHLNARDKLTSLRNMNTLTESFAKKLNLENVPGLNLVSNIVTSIGKEGERFVRGIIRNPGARNYYFDVVSAAAQNNPTLFIDNLKNMAQELPEFRKEEAKAESDWIIE